MNQTISDIQPQKKDPKRVNIFLDGKFAFGVSQESKIVNKLRINEYLTSDQVQKLIFNDQVERLYDKAVKFLSYRPRSEKEIRDNLLQKLWKSEKGDEEKKNFESSVSEVIGKLKKLKFINDLEFSKWWVEQRVKFKKTSPRIIKSELFKKGIDKDTIESVLDSVEIDPLLLANEAAKKKLAAYEKFDPKIFREKMGRFLASKGFDWEIVKKVVDTLSRKR